MHFASGARERRQNGATFRTAPVHRMPSPSLRRLLVLLVLASPAAMAQRDARQSFDLLVASAPTPVTVDGRRTLVYELHLANFAAEPLRLARVEVLADARQAPLRSLDGAALAAALGRPGLGKAADKSLVAPGMHAIVYLNLAVDEVPSMLWHRVEFVAAGGGPSSRVEGGRTQPMPSAALALGPPLRGGPWIAVYSAEWERGHRRVTYAVDGRVRIPGRHAIDWVRIDANGKSFTGEGKDKNQWPGYGADVLAVADATVSAMRDDVAEPTQVSADNPPVAIGDASGNYVALRLTDGRHAFYEHLQPGSIKVRRGDRVHRGEPIAALGYTGESTGPHLHFHVADAEQPLAAEGLPYALDGWRRLGAYASFDAYAQGGPWTPPATAAAAPAGDGFPAPFSVVQFLPAPR